MGLILTCDQENFYDTVLVAKILNLISTIDSTANEDLGSNLGKLNWGKVWIYYWPVPTTKLNASEMHCKIYTPTSPIR